MVARDGDLTPAFARWAIDLEIETEASHLVVVATGRVHNQARVMLFNHAQRRVSAGRDFELVVADSPAAAGTELANAFDRVSERILAEQLCDLDASVGLNLTRVVMSKFELLRKSTATQAQPVSNESSSTASSQSSSRPLALAAAAAASSDGIIDVEGSVSQDRPDVEVAHAENLESQMMPETRASWE